MTTRRSGQATGSDTRASRSREPKTSVRIYREVGLTVAVTDDPPQFIKLVSGQEMICPDDDVATVQRYKKKLDAILEADLSAQQEKYMRLVRRINKEVSSGGITRRRRPGMKR